MCLFSIMENIESLKIWKRSSALSAEIYQHLANLKDYGFKDQITRAGLSIPSNIAEGFERDSYKEFANFLKYAKGSSGELKTQVYIGMKIGYIDPATGRRWIAEVLELGKMIGALRKSMINNSGN